MGKNPLQSMTVRGLLVVLLGAAVTYFGVELDPESTADTLIEAGGYVIQLVGVLMSYFGRARAKEPLKGPGGA